MSFKIADIDFVFLSYDEPNAEKNFADLKRKVPWAKRVHGVYGFDAAHKACAEASDTERFITVDGDTIIEQDFTKVMVDLKSNITSRSWSPSFMTSTICVPLVNKECKRAFSHVQV